MKKFILVTDFDDTIVPSCMLHPEQRTEPSGYRDLIAYTQEQGIEWYGSTGRPIERALDDPLIKNLPLKGIGCKVGTELWIKLGDQYTPNQEFMSYMGSESNFNVGLVERLLNEATKKHFKKQPEILCGEFKISWDLQETDKSAHFEGVFHAILSENNVDYKLIICDGVSVCDNSRNAVVHFDVMHPSASKSSTISFLQNKHPEAIICFAGDSGNDIGAVCGTQNNHRLIVVGNAQSKFKNWARSEMPENSVFFAEPEVIMAQAVLNGLRHFHER